MLLSFTKTFSTFPTRDDFQPRHLVIIRSSGDSNGGDNMDINASQQPLTPPGAVEIRFKRGSRRKRKEEELSGGVVADKMKAKQVRKDWDSMTLAEKAIEVYVGEKGMLYWLNKFAYASIFIVIGGWILFRFVGPALGLYQLDTPPLAPDSLFKEGQGPR